MRPIRFLSLLGCAIFWTTVASAQDHESLTPGSTFRDCRTCPEMVVIPAGTFMKGSPQDEPGRGDDRRNHDEDDLDGPGGSQVEVSVPRFALGVFEITNREFQAFIEDAGYQMPGGCWALLHGDGTWNRYPEATWKNLGRPFEDEEPASCIHWDAARDYARWLSLRTGASYRLPTESEFEYALRAGSSTRYHFGDDQEALCRYGNVRDAAFNTIYPGVPTLRCDDGYAMLAPVGQFQPNAFGVYDMTGNVWEWLADCYAPSYANAPRDGSALLADPCEARSLRGGSWSYDLSSLRSADRSDDPIDALFDTLGFRVARDLDVAVALAPDWDLRVYEDRERGFSFLYPARLERSGDGNNLAFAESPKDISHIEGVPYIAVSVTKNDPSDTTSSLAEALAKSMKGEVVASKQSILRDGVTDATEIVVDWRHAGTERLLRSTSLSIVIGDQRVSVRLTKGPNSDWADLKQLLYTLRVH